MKKYTSDFLRQSLILLEASAVAYDQSELSDPCRQLISEFFEQPDRWQIGAIHRLQNRIKNLIHVLSP